DRDHLAVYALLVSRLGVTQKVRERGRGSQWFFGSKQFHAQHSVTVGEAPDLRGCSVLGHDDQCDPRYPCRTVGYCPDSLRLRLRQAVGPQFVVPGGEHQVESFLLLGVAYTLVAFLTDATFALTAGSAMGVVSGNRRLQKLMDRIVGTAFIGLGIRLSLTQR